ncbi:MAG: hypothetical protein JST15_03420 [Bacteroidetes bacterium]|nr:hypothetical protein [Bacteroidota bacterium]
MILQNSNINYAFKILLIVSFFCFPDTNYSQQKFGLKSDWDWDDLFNKAVFVSPLLIKSVDKLKNDLTISDARFIVRHLSELDSLQELKNLFIIHEKTENVSSSDSAIKKLSEADFHFNGEVEGLISAMEILTGLRNFFNPENKFCFTGKDYLFQPLRKSEDRIEIDMDYTEAENVLKYLSGDGKAETELKNGENETKILTEKKNSILNNNEFIYLLDKARAESPLLSIYKWINPGSYKNFGGIYIYRDDFSKVINKIRENESNIISDVIRNTVKYIPDSVEINVSIKFRFGNPADDTDNKKRTIEVSLENFSDDYSFIVRFINHQLFKTIERELHLKIEDYVTDSKDQEFIALISEIQENGIANYAGPLGSETRPWDLLEKDFKLFNNTFYHLRKNSFKNIRDSLIRTGFEGNAPFFTMAAQMAFIIESTLGRKALTESVSLGPVSFFNKYIKAYKDYPDKIRRVFTFRKDLERKLNKLEQLLPEKILRTAMSINKLKVTGEEKTRLTEEFVNTGYSKENGKLLFFLAGHILLEADQFGKASEYFLRGLNLSRSPGNLSCRIATSFMKKQAFDAAMNFFDECLKYNPEDAETYEKRGECLFYLNEREKSLSDFNKALLLNPASETAKKYKKMLE